MKGKHFIAVFLLLCLVPSLGLLVWGPAQAKANETLPSLPLLIDEEGQVQWDFLENLSDYLDHRFALRQEMVSAEHWLETTLLAASPEEDVILGREGWLFYGDTLADYEGTGLLTDRALWCAARTVALIEEYCQSQGAQFLFTIAPNKNSLYGSWMPDRYPTAQKPGNAQRLGQALEDQGVAYTDLFQVFRSQKKILYRKQDSHWTQEGAGLAGDTLLAALGKDVTPYYGSSTRTVEGEVGDLYAMLYPSFDTPDQDVQYTKGFTFTYDTPIRSAEDNLIRTSCSGQQGSLLMFRDSFGNALHPFLAQGFAQGSFLRGMPYDLTQVSVEGADTVVIELVERNLDWLLTKPPIFPAPTRQQVQGTSSAVACALVWEENQSLPDYCLVTGTYDTRQADTDSLVLLRFGQTVYEATPTGEGTFTAYLPQQIRGQEGTLLLVKEGAECSL